MTAPADAEAVESSGRPPVMPAAFIGHGNPLNALDSNVYTSAWSAFGRAVPRPRAILVVSAHWYIGATAVTAMERPRTIHDFSGFPRALFEVQYPAPGMPELVEEISDVVKPDRVKADVREWGIDHGTWSVLVHAFPAADIPVVQLSIDAGKPLSHHLELGARLAPLRRRGVLILGSGNIVHNLGGADPRLVDRGFDWARRFDDAAHEQMITAPGDFAGLNGHSDFDKAVPTPDHFVPALYFAGLVSADDTRDVEPLVQGCTYGSLSMTAYTAGLRY